MPNMSAPFFTWLTQGQGHDLAHEPAVSAIAARSASIAGRFADASPRALETPVYGPRKPVASACEPTPGFAGGAL
jgi:hypothetical protein